MNDLDENGWGHIHHAAFRGYVKSAEKFIKAMGDLLELETDDDLRSTPLLLAVMAGNLEMVQTLINLGANAKKRNSQDHGLIHLACLRQALPILEYLYSEFPQEETPVFTTMVKMLGGRSEDECEKAAGCFRSLLSPTEKGNNPYWESAVNAGLVPTLVRVIKSDFQEEPKTQCFLTLLHIQHLPEVRQQFHASGGLSALVTLLKATVPRLVQLAARVMGELCQGSVTNQDEAQKAGAIPALVRVMSLDSLGGAPLSAETLQDIIKTLGMLCRHNENNQSAAWRESGCFLRLAKLFENCKHKGLLIALTKTVGILGEKNPSNQNALLQVEVAKPIIYLTRIKSQELQLCAVEAISLLAEGNTSSQMVLLSSNVVPPLLDLLKLYHNIEMQEFTAGALWAIASSSLEQKLKMACGMKVNLLVEFCESSSKKLQLIGAEALGVLSQGPLGQQTLIGQKNGIVALIGLLRSTSEAIVLATIKTLRLLCTTLGCIPHENNQKLIQQNRGTRLLVALMTKANNEEIRAEAAVALAYCSMNNPDVVADLNSNIEFNYVRVLAMLQSKNSTVRLSAGNALATFSYNNVQQQRQLAMQGGVRYSILLPFLKSPNEIERCEAAYQVVILSKIIPDEEEAISCAAGIKILVTLLQESKDPEILALTSDFIARLAHTRHGIPQAIVSIGAVPALCELMLSPLDNVRGCAAIAIAYLTHIAVARREILRHCRLDPYLMDVLKFFTKNCPLNVDFLDGWNHCKRIGLPPVKPGRPPLVKNITNDLFTDPVLGKQNPSLILEEEFSAAGGHAASPSAVKDSNQADLQLDISEEAREIDNNLEDNDDEESLHETATNEQIEE